MICSKECGLEEEVKKCSLIKMIEPQTVEEKNMFDLYNELEEKEDDIEKIAEQTYEILIESSKQAAKKILEECQTEGKTNYSEEKYA